MDVLFLQNSKFLSLAVAGALLAGCSGIELADNRYDAFNEDIVCSGGDCPEGIFTSEIAALINERRERIAKEEAAAAAARGQAQPQQQVQVVQTTPVTVQEIQAITKKPDIQKTDRDREIEALLEELLLERRQRLARESAGRN